MPDVRHKLKVLKTIAPHQPGAAKLARQYGKALICVRHRTDGKGHYRFTTVELVVETTIVRPRQERLVHLRLKPNDTDLRRLVCAAGAVLDPKTGLWVISWKAAQALDLLDRVVKK